MNEDEMSFKHHGDHESGSLDHSAHENEPPGGAVGGGQGDGESRSDVTDATSQLTSRTDCDTPESSITVLAWQKGGGPPTTGSAADLSQIVRPGEYVMRSLFADFTVQAEKKMDQVLAEPQEKPLSKALQRGEDPVFDQLVSAFGCVAEHCLPSILRALFAWYERQMRPPEPPPGPDAAKKTPENRGKGLFSGEPVETKEAETVLQERRDLAVEFIFCLVLIEVLRQLPFHPGHEHLVAHIEGVAFRHFKYKEGLQNDPNATNVHTVADLYAEVIGVLAQCRFQSVRKRFTSELKELRAKEPNTHTTQSIISLLMGMKFFRVKMVPIEEFEASFQFMQECATYFTELKDKDIKHALAGLFVEILVPVAATVKNEVNVPCVKNFVESLYGSCLDMCTKSKHRLALFPLVTCLLCVSQKTFFLANWHYFLALCLSHLKNSRDPKISRVALESLYRLLWVYMIRIKCESNSATQSRLQSIVNSLFPKGSKAVVPRDTPLNIFVKIIQFIAQERLDFAMREIVFDLLSVGRPIKLILTPERMSIGLRAFLVVADSLQQKEGEPPMPRTSGVLPSGNTLLRVKKTYLNKMLTEDTARSIGIHAYFPHVRRVFVDILRALDIHYGRPLMMTSTQNVNKEPDEMITGERKPRIDLFRTCVAAVPRLIPEAMTRAELVDLLARLTTHMDEELRGLAYQSLQTLVIDFPDWRHDVIAGFAQFLAREVLDAFPQLVDNGLRMLLQLLTSWRNALAASASSLPGSLSRHKEAANQKKAENLSSLPRAQVFHQVEGFALVMLCNVRLTSRRLSVHILREVKLLNKAAPGIAEHPDQNVIDVIDKACPEVLEQCMPQLTCADKTAALTASCIDLQWIADRSASVWTAGIHEDGARNPSGSLLSLGPGTAAAGPDPWGFCLSQFLQRGRLLTLCPSAVGHAWPIVYLRLHALFPAIDPTPVSDNRASLLRSSAAPRKPPASEAARDAHLALWRYLALLAARVVPPVPCPQPRCASPDLSLSYVEPGAAPAAPATGVQDKPAAAAQPPPSPTGLYKLLVPLLRCETADVRDAAGHALGHINAEAVKDLMEEMVAYIREAVDRKTENMRRRRRRDALRLQLVRVFELIAERGTFGGHSAAGLLGPLAEYLDGARLCLELEADKQILREIKAHFCNLVCRLIHSFPLESRQSLLKRDLRRNLFSLFTSWAGPYGRNLNITQVYSVSVPNPPPNPGPETLTTSEEELQLTSLGAMSAVLTCGPCFDPSTLLAEDGILYPWLDMLLASPEEKTYTIGCQTVILLLECNPDMGPLLDWVVDRCYTAPAQVADGCFLALATIFSTREYPCDHYTAIINVALMNTGCPRTHIHDTALQLLHLLDKRFFGTVDLLAPPPASDGLSFDTGSSNERHVDAALLSNTYCRSQMHLSEQMSQLHPELTMPMFSEITHRFQTARPEVRQILLQYLLPWLHNMELLDPNVPPANPLSYYQYCSNDVTRPGCRREGWGSVEATEMVLNNLFYITAKFADELPKEIEDVWATLCSCWPNNMKVIIRYLIIMSGMAPSQLLVYAKRVVLYIARARPDRLLDEMVVELQTVETLSWLIERTETPPFYRLTSMRKPSNHSDLASDPPPLGTPASAPGTIHTKRHSAESESARNIGTCKSDSAAIRNSKFVPPRGSDKIRTASGPAIMSEEMFTPPDMEMLLHPDEVHPHAGTEGGVPAHNLDVLQPHPLPMPEYGGYFAPLTEYLPEGNPPSSGFHRCNVAIMLLTDLVAAPIELDWTAHLPLTLHILFLGLDHPRAPVLAHCKQLLLHLLLALASPAPWHQLTVAQILLNTHTRQLLLGLATPPTQVTPTNFTDPDSELELYGGASDPPATTPTGKPEGPPLIAVPEEEEPAAARAPRSPEPRSRDIQHVMVSLIDFLSSKHDQVLWAYEDITAKVWAVRSADQLDVFLRHVLRLFREALPHALISERWAQTALQLGLSCGSRHYAGRSLQIFRALRVPINSRMLTDILSRLVETVAETGEDMQGYVTELLLTLEAAVDALESDFRPLDHMKELFKSTPNLNNKEASAAAGKRSPGLMLQGSMLGQCSHMSGVHARSTSYSISYCTRKTANCAANLDSKGPELRSRVGGSGADECRPGAGSISPASGGARASPSLGRSRSAQSLKLLGEAGGADDKLTILAQAFWLAVSLLESDYEHEYLLALRLLARVLSRLPLDRPDARDKVDKLQVQLKPAGSWPGVHSLLLKGCTNPNTYEAVVPLLAQFTPLLELPVVDATQSMAFPMTVVALLPYMLLHYEDANELCIMSAENIAQLSAEKSKKLENLGTVMTLYSRRTFSKESFQWTKCVVKYLYDSYSHLSMTMLTFLVEVLEKGPPQMQLPVLNIIHCMLHYVDLNSSSHFNAELLRVIGKYIEGPNYKEALFILKLVVTRSSTLVTPPQLHHQYINWESHTASSSHSSFTEFKKELPGRTMEFTVDLSQTPVIGRKGVKPAAPEADAPPASPRRSLSLSPGDGINLTGWKRPWMSQSRVRDSLVNVLTTCGQRVGLPKSPSVIFSQSSDLLERQSSMASSTEEVSGPDLSGGTGPRPNAHREPADQFGVFKDFDFLEYESESVEAESTDNFNWGVRRRVPSEGEELVAPGPPLRPPAPGLHDENTPLLAARKMGTGVIEESSDDEIGSESPLDEIPPVPEFPNTSATHAQASMRPRTTSDTRSDTSGSSTGDISELTPCNTSPSLAFRPILREDTEELFRLHIQSLLQPAPASSLHLFHTLHRLLKDIVRRTVSLTRDATHTLAELGGLAAPLTGHFSGLGESLARLAAEVPLVYFSSDAIRLPPEPLRFGLLQMKEHSDTLLDRNDQAAECVDALRAVLKLRLGEEGGGGRSHEESVVETGRSLYKLYFQLMLLLESAHKMVALAVESARTNQLQDVSAEVILVRKSLVRAQEEVAMATPTPTPPPALGERETEGVILEYLAQAQWADALVFTRTHRNACLSEAMLPSTSEDDDVTNIISLYCQQVLREKPDAFIVTGRDLGHTLAQLMEGLMQVLTAVSAIEANLSPATSSSKHSSHLSTRC